MKLIAMRGLRDSEAITLLRLLSLDRLGSRRRLVLLFVVRSLVFEVGKERPADQYTCALANKTLRT